MTIQLPEDLEHYIHDKVRNGQFDSANAAVAEAVRRFKQWELETNNAHGSIESNDALDKPIWEVADELRNLLVTDELDKLPVDGADQHDHYIYGLPKHPAS